MTVTCSHHRTRLPDQVASSPLCLCHSFSSKNPLWADISVHPQPHLVCKAFPLFFCWVSSLVKKQELHLLESSPSELLHGLCPVLAAWNAPQEAAGREDTLIYFAWIRAKKHFSKAVQVIRSQLITKSSKNREKSIGNTNELQLSCICLQKSSF